MKTRNLILFGSLVLVASFFLAFFTISSLNEQRQIHPGVIYITPEEINEGIKLHEKTGSEVMVVGLLGETPENIIPQGDINDLLEVEE